MIQKKLTILIYFKNPKIIDPLGIILAEKGHRIMLALNLEMALEIMNNFRIDLIMIGTVNGTEKYVNILKKLKELFPIVPVMIISGNKLKKKDYLKFLYSGASGFINSSSNTEDLEKTIIRVTK